MDRVGAFFRERTPRRFIALAAFFALLFLFRKLLVLLVFFVAFERLIGWSAEKLSQRTRIGHKAALGIVAVVVLALAGGAVTFGVSRAVHAARAARVTLPARIAAFREAPAFQKVQEHMQEGADKLVDGAQHYASSALHFISAFGHVVLYALIGFILAVVFLLERDSLRAFARGIDPRSLWGTLVRWIGHVAEAMLVTVQFQLVVAACNAALTIPVLLLIGIPHVASLALMIFASGMVPVVGNIVSGAILSLLAYQAQGWLGVGLFVGLTFVLHKLESYYLNPRLAARHVKLPGFVLIVSLIAWEHLLGFAGLFLSFPFLFVAKRIRDELRAESDSLTVDEPARLAATGSMPLDP
jgi:predicted PurR-regulated permease PerM